MSLPLLRIVLLVRCLVALAFAWHLHVAAPATFPTLAQAFVPYTTADGVLALLLALLSLGAGWHRGLAGVAAVDGLYRLAAAYVLRLGPGIPYVAVTLLLYVGLLATLGFLVGLAELVEATRLYRETGRSPMSTALGAAGLATVALGAVAFLIAPVPSSSRMLLMVGAVLQAVVLLAVAIGAGGVKRAPPYGVGAGSDGV
jgi:hypothetical protein